jgi:hypothetical protein
MSLGGAGELELLHWMQAARKIFLPQTNGWIAVTGETWSLVGAPSIEKDQYGVAYAVNDGSTANYYTTPDSPAASVLGDITLFWSGKLASVTPSTYNILVDKAATGQVSYVFQQNIGSTNALLLQINIAGAFTSFTSSVNFASVGITANTRVWLYVQRSASTGVVKFFYSLDGTTYQQLGADVAGITGNIFDSTAAVTIGMRASTAVYPLAGKTYRASIYAGLGITGTPVVDFNPASYVNLGGGNRQGALFLMDPSAMLLIPYGFTPAAANGAVGMLLDSAPSVPHGLKYAVNDGSTTNFYTTPDNPATSVTGDITIAWSGKLASVAPADYRVLVDKWGASGQYSYSFAQNTGAGGRLLFGASVNGTSLIAYVSTVSLASVGIAINTRVWLYAKRVAATGVVSFFYSLDGSNFTQLGADVSGTAGSIYDSTTVVSVGIRNAATAYPLIGSTYRAQVFAGLGISGTPVVDFNPEPYTSGAYWDSATGERWTLVGSPLIQRETFGYPAAQPTAVSRPPRYVTPQTLRSVFIPTTQTLVATFPNLGACTFVRWRVDGSTEITEGVTVNGAVTITEANRVFCGLVIVSGTLTAEQKYVLTQLGGWYRPGLGDEKVTGYLQNTLVTTDGSLLDNTGAMTTTNISISAGKYYNVMPVGIIGDPSRGAISILRANSTRYFPALFGETTITTVNPLGAFVAPADAVGFNIYFRKLPAISPTAMSVKEVI